MEFILAQLPEDGVAKAGAGMLGTIIFVFIGLFIFFSMLFVMRRLFRPCVNETNCNVITLIKLF